MTKERITRLIMLYDADSGPWAAIVDSAKKMLMLKGCPLCSITHGISGEKSAWKSCKDELGVAVDYLHRNELSGRAAELAREVGLPCVLAEVRGELRPLLTPQVLDRCRGNVAEFRGKLHYYASAGNYELPGSPYQALQQRLDAQKG